VVGSGPFGRKCTRPSRSSAGSAEAPNRESGRSWLSHPMTGWRDAVSAPLGSSSLGLSTSRVAGPITTLTIQSHVSQRAAASARTSVTPVEHSLQEFSSSMMMSAERPPVSVCSFVAEYSSPQNSTRSRPASFDRVTDRDGARFPRHECNRRGVMRPRNRFAAHAGRVVRVGVRMTAWTADVTWASKCAVGVVPGYVTGPGRTDRRGTSAIPAAIRSTSNLGVFPTERSSTRSNVVSMRTTPSGSDHSTMQRGRSVDRTVGLGPPRGTERRRESTSKASFRARQPEETAARSPGEQFNSDPA
jgi:hypothetical protein